ncbi:MAG: hypothetical protein J7521_08760 [Caulobacter sp.]|nr:hypothetical protein [Caulobacter sp.]
MKIGQDLLVLSFDPPKALEDLIVDPACPRTGPAVLLFADSIDLDLWAKEPLEPQKALWTEVAIGYGCEVKGEPATAFHYPYLLLSGAKSDRGVAVADVEMTRFHAACPDYEGGAPGRRCAATARTIGGRPIADLDVTLQQPQTQTPAGLLRWVNRVRYGDVTAPGDSIDRGLWFVPAIDPQVADLWTGVGSATFGEGMGWSGAVRGEAWSLGVVYDLVAGERL